MLHQLGFRAIIWCTDELCKTHFNSCHKGRKEFLLFLFYFLSSLCMKQAFAKALRLLFAFLMRLNKHKSMIFSKEFYRSEGFRNFAYMFLLFPFLFHLFSIPAFAFLQSGTESWWGVFSAIKLMLCSSLLP